MNICPESGGSRLHKIIVIHAADQISANEFCNSIGAEGETFSVPLYDSSDALSGYWCGWNMTDEQLQAVESNSIFKVFNNSQEALTVTSWHPFDGE